MAVPFIGRLNLPEYTALIGSIVLVVLEATIRILTLCLPSSLIDLCYLASQRIFNRLTSPAQKRAQEKKKSVSTSISDASDFVELCRVFGYTAEEHVFQTKDGYLLGLHRLAWRRGEEETKVNDGARSLRKRVIYMHHGLLMNSEVWVCETEARRCLPFMLVEHGFDVWLGNNRGNKYSKKSVHCSASSTVFWNFSIDEFAFHDIPDSIAYVLEATGQPSLSYIGFSQGTAQAFAALSIHPKLNDQVNVFIALAPAMSPAGLSNGIVDALVKASPQVLYLLFGRRSILSSATLWQSLLYPPLFVRVIDLGLGFLFGWRTANISASQKLAAYPHLYSYTSTKSVVHWFQIIRTKSFQMYDDDVHPPLALHSKHTKVAKYPTRNIKTPVVLIYGGRDSLVDIRAMLRELPAQTVATEIPHYEHLDFLWARDVDVQVFRHVFDAIDSFTGAEHTKEEYARYRTARHASMHLASAYQHGGSTADSDQGGLSDQSGQSDQSGPSAATIAIPPNRGIEISDHDHDQIQAQCQIQERNDNEDDEQISKFPDFTETVSPETEEEPPTDPTEPTGTPETAKIVAAAITAEPAKTDEAPAPQPPSTPPTVRKMSSQRFRSGGSLRIGSLRGSKGIMDGIRLGSSRAVGGVTTEAAVGSAIGGTSSSDDGRRRTPS